MRSTCRRTARRSLVANADNNTVAVVDVVKPGASRSKASCPTGWYPTAVLFDRDGRRFFVLDRQGVGGLAEPRGPQPTARRDDGQYIGNMFQGAMSIDPDADRCGTRPIEAGARSHAVHGREAARAGQCAARSPIPRRVGDSSPIKYVFYVIRENRTLRPGARRPAEGERRPVAHALRRGRDAERARASRETFVDVRQLLRRRGGQLRRPRVLDRRVRDGLRREDVAGQLRPA